MTGQRRRACAGRKAMAHERQLHGLPAAPAAVLQVHAGVRATVRTCACGDGCSSNSHDAL
ncbi:hypothetical protein XabCFBP2524_02095 [Xanthomonas axonopodis pv. begoniae]|nr:hypothetical protein XabCFBP2524_02095 [Xanthomonas axonopodis pv. begoniae]